MSSASDGVRNEMNTFGFVCTTYYFYSQLTSKRFNYLTCWSVKRFNSSAIHDRQTERKQNSWRLDSVTRYLGGPIKARSGYRSVSRYNKLFTRFCFQQASVDGSFDPNLLLGSLLEKLSSSITLVCIYSPTIKKTPRQILFVMSSHTIGSNPGWTT